MSMRGEGELLLRIRNKIFLLINTLLSMGSGLITPIITLYIHNDLHKSLVTAGYVLLLYSGMIAVGYLLGGRLFDVWQPEALVYIGGTLAIFFLFLLALFPKWPFLITFLALYGAGQGLWRSAFSGYMAIIQENDHDIFNNNYWTANIGMGIATLLAGYLYSVSVHLVFVVTALLFTSGLFIFARYFSLPKKQDHIEAGDEKLVEHVFPTEMKRASIAILCSFMFLTCISYEQWESNISVLMTSQGIPVQKYSLLFTIATGQVIIFQPLLNKLFPHKPWVERFRLMPGLFLYGSSFLIVLGASQYWRFILGIVVLTAGEILVKPTIPLLLSKYSDRQHRGFVQSLGSLSNTLGIALGPVLGGFLITATGYSGTFIALFVLQLVMMLLVLRLQKTAV